MSCPAPGERILSIPDSTCATYHVYILLCSDGTLYTGITNRLERRLLEHNWGKGSKYTRGRLPVKFVYTERKGSKGAALRREREIKRMQRKEKLVICGLYGNS